MKAVVKYQTFDGELHNSRELAKRHLDNVYAVAIGKVIGALMDCTHRRGHIKVGEYIDTHLSEFLHLQEIKDDYALLNDQDEYHTSL